MIQSPPLASMLPFHHAMQVAAAQVRKKFGLLVASVASGSTRKRFWSP